MKKIFTKMVLVLAALFLTRCAEEDSFYANVMRSDLFYQTVDTQKYDFLWVMDNSSSMISMIDYVRDNMQQFIGTLNSRKSVDFQMAVTDTDLFSHNGNLIASPSGLSVVQSATSADPVADFASIVNNIQLNTATSFWENGLESSYQALYQHGSQFSRTGVPLVIIYISSYDDFSCSSNCWGVEPTHNPDFVPFTLDRYITYFGNVKQAQNADVEIFPIVGLPTSTCTVGAFGARYVRVMEGLNSGGVAGSVCVGDIAATYSAIAQTIADRGTVFQLSQPADGKQINVYVNNQLVPYTPDNYIFDSATNSIVFTGSVPPQGATIEVTYAESSN